MAQPVFNHPKTCARVLCWCHFSNREASRSDPSRIDSISSSCCHVNVSSDVVAVQCSPFPAAVLPTPRLYSPRPGTVMTVCTGTRSPGYVMTRANSRDMEADRKTQHPWAMRVCHEQDATEVMRQHAISECGATAAHGKNDGAHSPAKSRVCKCVILPNSGAKAFAA